MQRDEVHARLPARGQVYVQPPREREQEGGMRQGNKMAHVCTNTLWGCDQTLCFCAHA